MAIIIPALIAAGSAIGTAATAATASAALVGTAATAATATTAAAAATTGLFGAAGAFSLTTTLGTLGTIGSAFASLAGGMQQSQSMKFQQAQAKMQGRQFEIQALEQSNDIKRRMLSDLAAANANYSSRGVSTSSGTPQQAATEAIRVANRNVSTAQNSGAMNASLSGLQAGQYGTAASSAMNKGLFTALGKVAGQA